MIGVTLTFVLLTIWSAQGAVIPIAGPLQVSCPLLFCPDAGVCTALVPTTLIINGRKCMGCPKCANADQEAKRQLLPTDVAHLVGCPMFKCAAAQCENWEWQYSEFNGLTCRTCPVCITAEKTKKFIDNIQGATIGCPFFDCAYPGPCVGGRLHTSYITWNGQKCAACSSCIGGESVLVAHSLKRQIPIDLGNLIACPDVACAFPGNCLHTEISYIDWHGRQCPGCPVCADKVVAEKRRQIPIDVGHLLSCPMVDCAFPANCAHTETSYFDFNGRRCPGCPVCAEKLVIEKKRQLPIDVGHLVICPVVDCMFLGGHCLHTETSYIEWQGRQCPGCPVCTKLPVLPVLEKTEIAREVIPGEVIHLNICPMVMCVKPESCDRPYKTSTMMWMGKECPGCQYCPTEKRELGTGFQILNICPIPMCANPGPCDHAYSTSYSEINGKKCPMCPYCDNTAITETKRDVINTGIIHLKMCPIPMCLAPGPCDHPYNTSFMMMGEKKCPMCPYCAKEKREVIHGPLNICPLMPCAFPLNCVKTKTSQFEHNGMMCRGCPVCVEFGTNPLIVN